MENGEKPAEIAGGPKTEKARRRANAVIAFFFLAVLALVFFTVAPQKIDEIRNTIEAGSFTREFSSGFEQNLNATFPSQPVFVNMNGLARRLLLQREMNGVYRMKNGQQHMLMEDRDDQIIRENADSLQQFSEWLDARGIRFLWCQVPQKVNEEDALLPAGLKDYSNRVADQFSLYLEERNVPQLDFRKCIAEDGIERSSLFLKTEHHWSPQGGFYAFQKLCDCLRNRFGEEIPAYVTQLENYNIDTIERGSLGYYGQRTGWVFGGFDDFSLIYPKWETRQSSWAPHKELLREGSFYDAVFYTDYLNTPWWERGLYSTYIGGDWPVLVHQSETAPIDKTVMILIDSYGTVPESFLTTAYKQVVALDLRWVLRNQMGKTTAEYIEEYQPDIVIVMFNPNQIGLPNCEQFQYGI